MTDETHQVLRLAAERTGETATALARRALEGWLADWQSAQLDAELEAYIAAEAGGPHDLEPELAAASEELLLATR